MTIIFPNERSISWNRYLDMHWTERAKEVIRVKTLVKYSLKPHQRKMFFKRVNIFITVYFEYHSQDSSNICAKLYEDGLKGVVIFDDNPKYVGIVATESKVSKENPRVEIYIEEQI